MVQESKDAITGAMREAILINPTRFDELATEEPLEIRLSPTNKTLAVTMRTLGADFELVAGFLYSEGMIKNKSDIVKMSYCVDPNIDGEQRQNIVNIT